MAAPTRRRASIGLTSSIRAWFLDHPNTSARVADLVRDGVSHNVNTLRTILHNLCAAEFLEHVERGVFRLAALPDKHTEDRESAS